MQKILKILSDRKLLKLFIIILPLKNSDYMARFEITIGEC